MMGFNRVIQNARKHIYIQTPYFMPTETVLESLQTAALSGVKVQVMVPLKPGGFWMTWANESYYGDVLKAGAEIFAYKPGMLHAKTIIVDDDFCSVGSANLDFRSLGQTFEDSAFIYDTDMTTRVKQLFIEARQDCIKIDLDMWNGRNLRRRILESFVRIFSPLF
jgi:cardiolipin synthase